MIYTEKKAKELGKKHELSYFTLNRWKNKRVIPKKYFFEDDKLIQGMTMREAKNFTKLTLKQIQALLWLESGKKYNTVSISYWFSGKRTPRKDDIYKILDRKITERKAL